MRRSLLRLGVRLAALAIVGLLCVQCIQETPLGLAQARVPIGTARHSALAILERHAWAHAPCGWSATGGVDLFFFGSRSLDEAEVIGLQSTPKGSGFAVETIERFEPAAWQAAYGGCVEQAGIE